MNSLTEMTVAPTLSARRLVSSPETAMGLALSTPCSVSLQCHSSSIEVQTCKRITRSICSLGPRGSQQMYRQFLANPLFQLLYISIFLGPDSVLTDKIQP